MGKKLHCQPRYMSILSALGSSKSWCLEASLLVYGEGQQSRDQRIEGKRLCRKQERWLLLSLWSRDCCWAGKDGEMAGRIFEKGRGAWIMKFPRRWGGSVHVVTVNVWGLQRPRYQGAGEEKVDGQVYLWLGFYWTGESQHQKSKGVWRVNSKTVTDLMGHGVWVGQSGKWGKEKLTGSTGFNLLQDICSTMK